MTAPPGVEIYPEPARGFHPNGFAAGGSGPNQGVPGDYETDDVTAAAYNLLIGQPGLDLAEFARRLHCTVDSARCVLDRLADLGLLSRYSTGNESLVALSPLTAMHRLITRERDILEQRRRYLRETVNTYSSILSAYGVGSGSGEPDDSEVLPDPAAVHARLQDLAAGARHEVVSFRTFANPERTGGALNGSLDLEPLGRGVRVRALYLEAIEFDEAVAEYARVASCAGALVRLAPELPMSMIVYDGRTALVPRTPGRPADGALVLRQPAVVALLTSLFEARWELGRPTGRTGAAEPGGCTSAERAVVRLLATGSKDDAVARQLGTSVRTVRRVVSALMDRAGVTSRFAFGVHAARRDWI
ncbi:hypothetical protein OH807_35755 [Kitasatospora sp. NBC_01560]|uniref:hypothetical protein n=1 Tax=Kitasatospora sp. NBC_01560 TaxID=2975965 RepID=UPI0038680B81